MKKIQLAGHEYTNQPVVNDNSQLRLNAVSATVLEFVSSAVFEGMNNYQLLAPPNFHELPFIEFPVYPNVASAATIASSCNYYL